MENLDKNKQHNEVDNFSEQAQLTQNVSLRKKEKTNLVVKEQSIGIQQEL